MSLYILTNHIASLLVSMGLLTTLSFDSEITSYLYGGGKNDLYLQVTNNSKTLALKPKKEGISSNLLVITKNRKYYFNVEGTQKNSHKFIEIRPGQINTSLKSIVRNSNYEIFQGASSILFVNKKKIATRVNEFDVESKIYLSKGIPIFVEGKRILN